MRRSYEAEASSTTVEAKVVKCTDPSEWSIDDVVKHICDTDVALAPHAVLFRKHVSSELLLNLMAVCNMVGQTKSEIYMFSHVANCQQYEYVTYVYSHW